MPHSALSLAPQRPTALRCSMFCASCLPQTFPSSYRSDWSEQLQVLKDAGYAVAQAEHAPAALTALASGAPIDLVFSDIVLPHGMSGITFAHEVQMLYPRLPVLLTTG